MWFHFWERLSNFQKQLWYTHTILSSRINSNLVQVLWSCTYSQFLEVTERGPWRPLSLVSWDTRFHPPGIWFHPHLSSHSGSPRINWTKNKTFTHTTWLTLLVDFSASDTWTCFRSQSSHGHEPLKTSSSQMNFNVYEHEESINWFDFSSDPNPLTMCISDTESVLIFIFT